MKPMVFGLILGLAMTLFFTPIIFLIALRARRRREKREKQRDAQRHISTESLCEAWLERTEMAMHTSLPRGIDILHDPVDRRAEHAIRQGIVAPARRIRRGLGTIQEANESRANIEQEAQDRLVQKCGVRP
jgi:hypothetical protein